MARSRPFGSIDRRGAVFRVRYPGPDGRRHTAPQTFKTKSDARAYLSTVQADITRRAWRAPQAGSKTLGTYFEENMLRPDLRDGTKALYEGLWNRHLSHVWANASVGQVTRTDVRAWHTTASRTVGPTALAQSYRLLRALFNVAVADEAIAVNPCQVRGAGSPRPARPSRALEIHEVHLIAKAVPARYRALVLVLASSGLRFGEAAALRRLDVSPDGRLVRVERSVSYLKGRFRDGPTKTGGRRTVALPDSIATELLEHLSSYAPEDPQSLVFGTASGNYLSNANFGTMFRRAVKACGVPAARPHELRHTAGTLAARVPGTTTADVMQRIGHSTPDAALIYQHSSPEQDTVIARGIDVLGWT